MINKQSLPKVKLKKQSLVSNSYCRNDEKWSAIKLIEFCKNKQYREFDLPVAGIHLDVTPFNLDCFDTFVWQMKRVLDCDLKHPIILDNTGYIADGWHRVAKAIVEGHTTIKAIRMEEMPKPDNDEK